MSQSETEQRTGEVLQWRLTEPERKALVMALTARMRTETGTFHELLRRVVEKIEAGDA